MWPSSAPVTSASRSAGLRRSRAGAVLVDVDADRVAALNRGESYIEDVPSESLAPLIESGGDHRDDRLRRVERGRRDSRRAADAAVGQPRRTSGIVLSAAGEIAGALQSGHLVVLESTTYPGTTREEVLPVLETSGLTVGTDFNLAFSPERVDPGRTDWTTQRPPQGRRRHHGGCPPRPCALRGGDGHGGRGVLPEAAELTKLLENIFRSVNIALVNELAHLCDRMGVDVWEVVDAAATKPYGFMRFEPAPASAGTACRSTFYLSWRRGVRLLHRVHRARRGDQPERCPTSAWTRSRGRSTP